MDMTINQLPARTWEHLRMNECRLKNITVDGAQNVQLEIAQSGVSRGTSDVDWTSLCTGLGKDMDELTADVTPDALTAQAGTCGERPVIYRLHYTENGNYANRVEISAGQGSKSDYIFVADNESGVGGRSALQVKVDVGAGAHVRLYFVQKLDASFEVMQDVGIRLAQDAEAELVTILLGGSKVYAGGFFDLNGQNSKLAAKIGYFGKKDQHLDMNYVAHHSGKQTRSVMESSGVLWDNASKLFRGTIYFLQGCSGARGDETEDVLLIGEDVANQTIPLILCAEEDVEGNHGATIGRLDESILFYLGSRGISEEEAERIIAHAKLDALCQLIPSQEIREEAASYDDGL